MKKNKKRVVRKMTQKNYAKLLWLLENPNESEDTAQNVVNRYQLDDKEIKKWSFYVTNEENEIIKRVLGNNNRKMTFDRLIRSVGGNPDEVKLVRYK